MQPRAFLSAPALQGNYAKLRAQGLDGALDLRADAWGHGADFVTAQLPEAAGTQGMMMDNRLLLGLAQGYEPVMMLQGVVLSTKKLSAGEGVSYGYTYRAERDTTVALVTGGYAHGIVRALGNNAAVSYGEPRFPIVGRVAMDVCVIETGDFELQLGARVMFFGPEHPIQLWEHATGFTSAELVTACGLHAQRAGTA